MGAITTCMYACERINPVRVGLYFKLCIGIYIPGAKVRVITREARYYAKTRAFASFYAIISRAHAARAVT